jgi:hypothetical protein
MRRQPHPDQKVKWCVCGDWFQSEKDEREHKHKCPGPMQSRQIAGIEWIDREEAEKRWPTLGEEVKP